MTFALIVIVFFCVVSFSQGVRRTANADNIKRHTKTNTVLQEKIAAAIKAKIDTEIARALIFGVSKHEALEQLYPRYEIPRQDEVEDTVYAGYIYDIDPNELNRIETELWRDADIELSKEEIQTKITSEYEAYLCRTLESNLIYLLTKREMVRRGYSYSYNKKESEWQEAKKSADKFLSIRNKYPWL